MALQPWLEFGFRIDEAVRKSEDKNKWAHYRPVVIRNYNHDWNLGSELMTTEWGQE